MTDKNSRIVAILSWAGGTVGFVMVSSVVGLLLKLNSDMATVQEQVSRVEQIENLLERDAILETKVSYMQETLKSIEVTTPYYLQLSSGHIQTKEGAHPVELEYRDAQLGFAFDPRRSKTDITIPKNGAYFVIAAGQVGAEPFTELPRECVRLWTSLNGRDMANSNVKYCFNQMAPDLTDVLVAQSAACYREGDVLRLMTSSDSTTTGLVAFQPSDGPFVPSMIFTIFRLGDC